MHPQVCIYNMLESITWLAFAAYLQNFLFIIMLIHDILMSLLNLLPPILHWLGSYAPRLCNTGRDCCWKKSNKGQ